LARALGASSRFGLAKIAEPLAWPGMAPTPSGKPDVADSWARIRAWLGEHAPAVLELVNPPASEPDLFGVAEEIGAALPEELLDWWRIADGFSGHVGLIPSFFTPYSVEQALQIRQIMLEVWCDEATRVMPLPPGAQEYVDEQLAAPAGTPCPDVWLPVWLPIAGSGGGQDLFVDLRPGPLHGCVTRFDKVETAQTEPLWPGVGAMLASIADAFEQGSTTVGGFLTTVEAVDGHIIWDKLRRNSLTTVNELWRWWSNTSRPSAGSTGTSRGRPACLRSTTSVSAGRWAKPGCCSRSARGARCGTCAVDSAWTPAT
jgi:cell wall assembly regulator SMI1